MTTPAPNPTSQREWFQDDISPDVDDATWDAAIKRLDRAVDAVIAKSPELARAAAGLEWIAETDSKRWGAAAQSDEGMAVAISFKCLDHDDEVIEYVVAHEICHHMLGHVPFSKTPDFGAAPDPSEGDEPAYTMWRIHQRSVETIVADQLTRLGFDIPQTLHGYARGGEWGVGFNVAGLTPQEIYDMLCGRMRHATLKALAAQRGCAAHSGKITDTSVTDAAIAFWQGHMDGWRDEWTAEHQELVTEVSGLPAS